MKAYLSIRNLCGHYMKVLVEVPYLNSIPIAEERIKKKYGLLFFSGFINNCDTLFLSKEIWNALIETEYPIKRFQLKETDNDWAGVNSLAEAISIDPNPTVAIEFCFDAYIWLVNAFGAEVIVCERDMPTINCCGPGNKRF